jgi:arginine decarboxylase
MLVLNVFETARMDNGFSPIETKGETPEVIVQLEQTLEGLSHKTLHEHWHDALHLRDQANMLFELGYLSLHNRARAEQIFWRIASRAEKLMRKEKHEPDELEALETLLADKYFCNFSVFQSLPDAWAIGQQFPVVPLHRLHERPTRRGILQDLTCDSDGKITSYIGHFEKTQTLPLHPLRGGEPYYLGVFLTGAYQEILGDLHNLFGDTNAIHIALDEQGGWRYEQVIRGETVADVLLYVQFTKEVLIDRIERHVQAAVREGRMTASEGRAFQKLYESGMSGYTYLRTLPAPKS